MDCGGLLPHVWNFRRPAVLQHAVLLRLLQERILLVINWLTCPRPSTANGLWWLAASRLEFPSACRITTCRSSTTTTRTHSTGDKLAHMPKTFYGKWIVVACCLTFGISVGLPYYNMPFFYDYYKNAFHW